MPGEAEANRCGLCLQASWRAVSTRRTSASAMSQVCQAAPSAQWSGPVAITVSCATWRQPLPALALGADCEPLRFAIAGDPRQPAHLRSRLRLAAFSSAIVLCDVAWTDPDPYDGVDEIDRRISCAAAVLLLSRC